MVYASYCLSSWYAWHFVSFFWKFVRIQYSVIGLKVACPLYFFIFNKDLDPNTDDKVGDTTYKTDANGRVEETSYNVTNTTSDRNTYQQGKAGKTDGYKDGQANDQGGHLQATTHGGAGEQINLLPQDAKLNNSEWKKMENTWTKAANEGKDVKVKIKPVYSGDSKRPSEFRVEYSIDGTPKRRIFPNGGS